LVFLQKVVTRERAGNEGAAWEGHRRSAAERGGTRLAKSDADFIRDQSENPELAALCQQIRQDAKVVRAGVRVPEEPA